MSSTVLPLFWSLSSHSKPERIDASVKLVAALEQFQVKFREEGEGVGGEAKSQLEEDEEDESDEENKEEEILDAQNAPDVAYSVKRLIRGLASPRESSRLGFAVALTELLTRLPIPAPPILHLLLRSTQTSNSLSGHESRDLLFARLFGLLALIQSRLLFRSELGTFKEVVFELLELGDRKSWLREPAWWALSRAVEGVSAPEVQPEWKEDALTVVLQTVFPHEQNQKEKEKENKEEWSPEKVALAIQLQDLLPGKEWKKLLAPTFKGGDLLSGGNLATLGSIMKESTSPSSDPSPDPAPKLNLKSAPSWKPQVHYAWDVLLDRILPPPNSGRQPRARGSVAEFFRVVVDDTLFTPTSSPHRKYWGFQIFLKALPRAGPDELPMLFTRNLMRSWINHLAGGERGERALGRVARGVATSLQTLASTNPHLGFALVLQLTGPHGSPQFDKLTKTKTVESLLTKMDEEGIRRYVRSLVRGVDEEGTEDVSALNARRAWTIDQLAALIRNGAVPKEDGWIGEVIDWLILNGLFLVKHKPKSKSKAKSDKVPPVPSPPFSDELRKSCRARVLGCLAELMGQGPKKGAEGDKTQNATTDPHPWIARVITTIRSFESDQKHFEPLVEFDEDEVELHKKAEEVIERLGKVEGEGAAQGTRLLVAATLVQRYCAEEEERAGEEALEACIEAANQLLPSSESKKSKKASRKSEPAEGPPPVDVEIDVIIGYLEKSTTYLRTVANQVFGLLAGEVRESTIELILAQLERRSPAELAENEDEEMEDVEGSENGDEDVEGDGAEDVSSEDNEEDEEESDDEAPDLELRRKIEEALRVNGIEAATDGEDDDEESEEELMDDDQMMAIDEQLAAVFRERKNEKQGKNVNVQREATHFKNRVLDLVDIYIKKEPSSPYISRIILPLVDLVMGSGSDEKQLSDKAGGILRTRIGKLKEVPSSLDVEQSTKIFEELHTRARKARSGDLLATIGPCALYMARVLAHAQQDEVVLEVYRRSLKDFMERKASPLNSHFFEDFIRRQSAIAWRLRSDLLTEGKQAVNVYRQGQAFHLIQVLLSQISALNLNAKEVFEFMSALRETIHESISAAADEKTTMTAAQIKDLFKLGLAAIRQTKSAGATPQVLLDTWKPEAWQTLGEKLTKSDRFKSSTGLRTTCKQMVQLSQASNEAPAQKKTAEGSASKGKRKADEDSGAHVEAEGAAPAKKVKRSKANKTKS